MSLIKSNQHTKTIKCKETFRGILEDDISGARCDGPTSSVDRFETGTGTLGAA